MKKDTSNIVDLDSMFSTPKQETKEVIQEAVQPPVQQTIKIDFDEVIAEWSYRCPKGYPTTVAGRFVDSEEIAILNEILQERYDITVDIPTHEAVDLGSNKTDAKEALVMVFLDCLRADMGFKDSYAKLQKGPDKASLADLKKVLADSLQFKSDYGSGVNVKNLHKFITEVLTMPARGKDKNYILVNNGFSAANSIVSDSKIKGYLKGKAYATRGAVFTQIRKNAVKFFQAIKVDLNFEDNWCPGDFYLMKNKQMPEAANIIDLNKNFAGPSYPNGTIVAVSLKMEDAQAGKGTTFLTTVITVPNVDKKGAAPKNEASKLGTNYMEAKRLMDKYIVNASKNPLPPEKLKAKLGPSLKMIHGLMPDKKEIKNIDKFISLGANKADKEKQSEFLIQNYLKMGKEVLTAFQTLDGKILSTKNTKAYSDGFKQAYTDFAKYLNSVGIQSVKSAGADAFTKAILSSKKLGSEGGPQKVLIKKAECYTRAVELIQKWSDSNKQIAKPFERIGGLKNPFLAITMFAIAQHGANPDFFKVHGSNNGMLGTVEIFPAKSKVDEKSMVQTVTIKDSPDASGFEVNYNMSLNNVNYKTTLSFRFSTTQFRVEVQKLEVEG